MTGLWFLAALTLGWAMTHAWSLLIFGALTIACVIGAAVYLHATSDDEDHGWARGQPAITQDPGGVLPPMITPGEVMPSAGLSHHSSRTDSGLRVAGRPGHAPVAAPAAPSREQPAAPARGEGRTRLGAPTPEGLEGGAVHSAGSHGNPRVEVDAAAELTSPVAAGNDPGGSRPPLQPAGAGEGVTAPRAAAPPAPTDINAEIAATRPWADGTGSFTAIAAGWD